MPQAAVSAAIGANDDPPRLGRMKMLDALTGSVATLAVSTIYCIWRAYTTAQVHKEQTLRQRVTYMLWTMAEQC